MAHFGNYELDPNFNFVQVGQDVELIGHQYNQCLNESQVQSAKSACASIFNIVGTSSKSNKRAKPSNVWKYFTIKEGVNSKLKKEELAFCLFCHSSLSFKSNGGTRYLKRNSDKSRAKYNAKDP